MQALNDLEMTLLNGLTIKYPSLKSHIPYLKVTQREMTGAGMYVHFAYVDFNGEFADLNALFTNEERIKTQNLAYGLGYVIDITEGEIKYIELITYGEKWNGKLTEYTIVDIKENE